MPTTAVIKNIRSVRASEMSKARNELESKLTTLKGNIGMISLTQNTQPWNA